MCLLACLHAYERMYVGTLCVSVLTAYTLSEVLSFAWFICCIVLCAIKLPSESPFVFIQSVIPTKETNEFQHVFAQSVILYNGTNASQSVLFKVRYYLMKPMNLIFDSK